MTTRPLPIGRPVLVFLAVAALVAAAVVAVAVADGSGDGEDPAVAAGVTATIEQTTAFQPRGLLEVRLHNASDQPLSITRLRLLDHRFDAVARTARDVDVAAGPRRVMIPLPYGRARCEPVPAATTSNIEVGVEQHGDAPVLVPVDAEGEEFLRSLHDRECGQQRIRDAVSIGFSGPYEKVAAATVQATLRVERRNGSDDIEVTTMRGTVVFTVVLPDSVPLLEIAGDETAGSTPVEISAARCDAHALIESKKSYRFPLWVSVDHDEARYIEVEPTGEARQVLEAALQEGCFGSR